jgi:hypothetical protein
VPAVGLCDSIAFNNAWLSTTGQSETATPHRAVPLHSRRRISTPQVFRPFRSQIRQSYFRHSHHGHFMDTRHIGYIRASLDFRLPFGSYGTSLPTLAGFVRSVYYVVNACRSISGNLSGRCSLIRFLGISVLLQPLGRNGITFYRDSTHRTTRTFAGSSGITTILTMGILWTPGI